MGATFSQPLLAPPLLLAMQLSQHMPNACDAMHSNQRSKLRRSRGPKAEAQKVAPVNLSSPPSSMPMTTPGGDLPLLPNTDGQRSTTSVPMPVALPALPCQTRSPKTNHSCHCHSSCQLPAPASTRPVIFWPCPSSPSSCVPWMWVDGNPSLVPTFHSHHRS